MFLSGVSFKEAATVQWLMPTHSITKPKSYRINGRSISDVTTQSGR